MFKTIILFVAALLTLCQSPLSASAKPVGCIDIPVKVEAESYLHDLQLCNAGGSPPEDDTQVVSTNNDKVVISLGLGEKLDKTIILRPHNRILEFKVEQSFETSMTVMNEGPHMDLLDWQHHLADWEELPQKNATTFLAHDVSNTPFPAVTTEEIVAAVAKESAKWAEQGYDPGDRWITLARDCKAADSYPCGISVSKVFFRIMVKVDGQWRQIKLIEFKVPMGC